MILDAGSGYDSYQWSTGDSSQTIYIFGNELCEGSHDFGVVVYSGNCFYTDTMTVQVLDYNYVFIGNDTVIYLTDSLTLDAGPEFDKYFWSIGDTTQSIQITGDDWGVGNYDFYVEVYLGNCYYSDTINVQINDNSGLSDIIAGDFFIYPNPVIDIITFENYNFKNIRVQIFNLKGIKMMDFMTKAETYRADVSALPKGIYLCRIKSNEKVKIIKLVKH